MILWRPSEYCMYLLVGWYEATDMLWILLNIPELQIVHGLDAVALPLDQGDHPPPEPGPAPAAVHHHPQLQEQVQDQESHRKPDNLPLHIFRDAKIFKPLLTEKLHNTIVEDNY